MAPPHLAVVEARAEPMPGAVLLWLHAPALAGSARPGQFVMYRPGPGYDPYLRYPLPIHRLVEQGLALYVTAADPAWPSLSALRVGDACDLEGPCGCPATPPHRGANLALIGQGPRIAPLVALIDGGWGAMQMVTAVATAGQAYPAALLPARVAHTWFAGQQGEQAFWGAVAEVARWAEAVYLSGTERFYARARDTIARERIVTPQGAVQAWMWRDMACGSGACGACLVPTRHGARRACTDGPWLDVADLILAAMPEA